MLGAATIATYITPPAVRLSTRRRLACQHGFSLIELMIGISVALILAGILMINVRTAIRGIRLNESSAGYANLLQQARIRAVRDDRFYTVYTVNPVGGGSYAFVDLQGTAVLAPGDPVVVFQQGVGSQPFASGPSFANLRTQFLPNTAYAQSTVNTTAAGPTFGPRGLPCTPVGGTCPYLTPPNFVPVSYVTFLQNNQGGKWQAVTVTPAGRVRQWAYDGTATWSPMN